MDTKQLADRFIGCLHRLEGGGAAEVDALTALFADDAEITNPQLRRRGDEAKGPAGVQAFWQNYRASFRDIVSEFDAVTAAENAAGLFWRSQGTDAQGRAVDYCGATMLMFDAKGRIRAFRGYFDSRELEPPAAS